jgi:hypothetical protein
MIRGTDGMKRLVAVPHPDRSSPASRGPAQSGQGATYDGIGVWRRRRMMRQVFRFLRGCDALRGPVAIMIWTEQDSLGIDSDGMANPPEAIIRCPYCKMGTEFRPMVTRVEGWLQCESCGHNAMPLDPGFRCACERCSASQGHALPDWPSC